MYIAKVVGNVVATKKNDTLMGSKLMIVQPVNSALKKKALKRLLQILLELV